MEFGEESSPALAFDKDAFELTVEDVYDISYVIGRDLLKISSTGEEVSDLQFRIVRVLEMFETLVNKYNLSVEELRMERDNLKSELDRLVQESSSSQGTVRLGSALLGSLDTWPSSQTDQCLTFCILTQTNHVFVKAGGGTEPAGGGPVGPQQTPLHHAGAERGSAREEPAEGSTHGGPGRAAAVQEVFHVTHCPDITQSVNQC